MALKTIVEEKIEENFDYSRQSGSPAQKPPLNISHSQIVAAFRLRLMQTSASAFVHGFMVCMHVSLAEHNTTIKLLDH
jgi:hypothetical protein